VQVFPGAAVVKLEPALHVELGPIVKSAGSAPTIDVADIFRFRPPVLVTVRV